MRVRRIHRRTSVRCRAAVLLIGGALAGPLHPQPPADGSPSSADVARGGWIEITTPNFLLVSDVGAARATRLARDFEEIRFAILRAYPMLAGDRPPLHILAAATTYSFQDLLPSSKVVSGSSVLGGLFLSGLLRDQIVMQLEYDERQILYHEYFHSVSREALRTLPRWLNEGLADFWSVTEVFDDKIRFGVENERRMKVLLDQGLMPMGELLSSRSATPGVPLDTNRFYAQAWAVVHYLMMDPQHQRWDHVNVYLQGLARGLDEETAWTEAFGESPDKTGAKINRYLRRGRVHYGVFEVSPEVGGDISARPLTRIEALVRIGEAMTTTEPELAEELLDEALRLAPNDVAALEADAYVKSTDKRHDEAVVLLERAEQTGGATFVTPFLLGRILRRKARGADDLRKAEQALLRSLSMRPRFAPAEAEVGAVYARLDEDYTRAIILMRRAAEHEPADSGFHIALARVLRLAADDEAAQAEVGQAVVLGLATGHASGSNRVCWQGALAGFAADVLPVCERAVELAPTSPGVHDTRGVARAATGDRDGALEDFRFFLENTTREDDDETVVRRTAWVERLERGENPIDDAVLAELSDFSF